MSKFIREITVLSWTLGSTGLVLITLSGDTLKWGVWISVLSLVTYVVGVLLGGNDD